MSVCILYRTVVTQLRQDLVFVVRTVCVPITFAQVPSETGTFWSSEDHGGILETLKK